MSVSNAVLPEAIGDLFLLLDFLFDVAFDTVKQVIVLLVSNNLFNKL